jgi:putative Holliday junction resolvase
VETLPGGEPVAVAAAVARITAEYQVVAVVVGLPMSLSGAAGAAAVRVRRYAEVIARRIAPIPVRLVDERMTTVTATRSLRAAGVRGRDSRKVVDQVAATVILQAALDGERHAGRPIGVLVDTVSS